MKYNPAIVRAAWRAHGIPEPQVEFHFHPQRKWRFDFAWPEQKLAVEVQGATFGTGKPCRYCGQRKAGGHTRGAALKLEWEKLNTAAIFRWRILFCEPRAVMTADFANQILAALAE